MSSSAPTTPKSAASSMGERDQESTQPSSPAEHTPDLMELKAEKMAEQNGEQVGQEDEEDDEEDMGMKAKALTNLLKTSSVLTPSSFVHRRLALTHSQGVRCYHGR